MIRRLPIALLLAACAARPDDALSPPRGGERTTETSSAASAASVRASDGPRPFEIEDVYRVANVGAPVLSPDRRTLVFTVQRFDFDATVSWSELWRVDVDGSNARALTSGRRDDHSPTFSPDGETLLFVSSRSGSSQLWTLPLDGGDARQLTDFACGVSDPVWSPDGRWIAVTSEIYPECGLDEDCQRRQARGVDAGPLSVHVADELLYRHWTQWSDGKLAHILLVDARSGHVVRDLTPGPWEAPTFQVGGARGYSFSPDGRELCYVQNRDEKRAESTNADLWIVPIGEDVTPDTAHCVTARNDGFDGAPLYSPDGLWIAFTSQERAGYESDLKRLALYDRRTLDVRYLTTHADFDQWVTDMRFTADGRRIVFQAEVEGRTPLYRIDVAGGEPRELVRHGTVGGFAVGARDDVYYMTRTVDRPSELYARTQSSERVRLTQFNARLEAEVDLRPVEELWVDAEDGTRVHVFLVKPHDFDPASKYPLILNVHGGPQSQWTDAFRGDWQVYPAKGYVVAFANPTGSNGYGQDYCDAIQGDWGGRVYRDLMRVTDVLEALPYVDAARMGSMGWSYGGYMMMWMQGHTRRFACQAAMMGLYDLTSFYGATEELWFPEHDLMGVPWESEHYQRWSPSRFAGQFATPALVITGERDYRVPYTQSLQYFTALQKRGIPSRLVVFPNAGHWPAWHEMAFYYNAHLDWFHRYLGGEPAPWNVLDHARNRAFGAHATRE